VSPRNPQTFPTFLSGNPHRECEPMSVDASTLVNFEGKQVVLHLIEEDGSVTEKNGKVEGASEFGIAFKEKGRREVDLVEPNQIEEIELAPEKPRTLSQKKLKPVADSNVRQHLLDRHGYSRSAVNKMSDEQGAAEHNGIDHSDLGHRHLTEEEVAAKSAESAGDDADSE